jgi:DNA uptake protein ComE-like DNA-binding protein
LEKYFYLAPSEIKKLQINSDPYKTLIAHPYLDSYLVKTIIQHREKRGKIKNMQEFQEITHAYPELVEKLTPYLSFE